MAGSGPYFPPRSLTRPLLSIIRDVDPDYDRDATKLRRFEFPNGRTFFEKPSTLFPYNED
jgi:hypothetical protein